MNDPDRADDETDENWGDWREGQEDDGRLTEDRPPHWDGPA